MGDRLKNQRSSQIVSVCGSPSAWESLRKALKATHDEAVWHLAGDTSAPFLAPAGTDIAMKVIDERGNELPVIRPAGLK